MKIKLRSFDSVIYTEEHIQEVEYIYSIDELSGVLKIPLTIPEEADPVEQFILHIKDLYKYNIDINYIVYYGKYKYKYTKHKNVNGWEWFIVKTKMW